MCKLLPAHKVQEHLIPRHIPLKSVDEWYCWIPCTFIAMKVFSPLTHNEQSNIITSQEEMPHLIIIIILQTSIEHISTA